MPFLDVMPVLHVQDPTVDKRDCPFCKSRVLLDWAYCPDCGEYLEGYSGPMWLCSLHPRTELEQTTGRDPKKVQVACLTCGAYWIGPAPERLGDVPDGFLKVYLEDFHKKYMKTFFGVEL